MSEELAREVSALRQELREHTARESAALEKIAEVIHELGTPDQIRIRRIFVEMMIDRETTRMAMRRKIIESGTVWALIAVGTFFAIAAWNEIVDLIRSAFKMRK